tara:strand:- start:422 stop:928 length:507 start_codon:yes stop_codon:yes gene_type:complete
VEPLCAILRERFGEEALLSAGFTHFGIVETVTVLANTIAASPDEHGVPLGRVPPDVLCDVRAPSTTAQLHHRPAPAPPSPNAAPPPAQPHLLPSASCVSARPAVPCWRLPGTFVAPSWHLPSTFEIPSWQAFEQTLALARGTAAGSATTPSPAAPHATVAVDGPPTDI